MSPSNEQTEGYDQTLIHNEETLQAPPDRPRRSNPINLAQAVGIVFGGMSTSGILFNPNIVFIHAGSTGLTFMIWIICGVFTIVGGLCFAELSGAVPRSGGEFSYILSALGDGCAFQFMWISVFIVKPLYVTVSALTFVRYVLYPLYPQLVAFESIIRALAFLLILSLIVLNIVNKEMSIKIGNIFNYVKLLTFIFIICTGICALKNGGYREFYLPFYGSNVNFSSVSLAFYNCLYAFNGWQSLIYTVEEMRTPTLVVTHGIVFGLSAVNILYLFLNVSYIAILGLSQFHDSPSIFLSLLSYYHPLLKPLYLTMVCVSMLSNLFVTIFTSSQLSYTAGRAGHLPFIFSCIHKRYRTPVAAFLLTFIMSSLLLAFTNDLLTETLVFFNLFTIIYFVVCFSILIYVHNSRRYNGRPFSVPYISPFAMIIISLLTIITHFYFYTNKSMLLLALMYFGAPFAIFVNTNFIKWPPFLQLSYELSLARLINHLNLTPQTLD